MNRSDFIKTMAATTAGVAVGGAASLLAGGNAAAAEPQAGTPGSDLSAYPLKPSGGLTLPDYYRTTPSVRNRSTYFPGTEELGKDEMRIIFMGSTGGCDLKRNQASMSIYVQLGNGDAFIFDLGIGTFKNYVAMQVPVPKIDNIFLTHLHADHMADVLPVYCFGPLYGRFQPLQVYGPSGRTKQDGTAWFCEKLQEMTHWGSDSFKIMPAGEGFGIDVHEFDYKDPGGVAYERNGVRIIHWPASHTKDGASCYRLDWNGLSFVYLGDGRPSQLAIKYGKGADILAMETFPELISMTSASMGIPAPALRYGMDTFHSPCYAAGYIFREANVRMGVLTHGAFDIGLLPEILAETRVHYKGLIGLGMPDFATFNVTKDAIWRREGAVADFDGTRTEPPAPGAKPPGFPPNAREDIQEQSIRENEIDPKLYYPEGTLPQLVPKFPGKK